VHIAHTEQTCSGGGIAPPSSGEETDNHFSLILKRSRGLQTDVEGGNEQGLPAEISVVMARGRIVITVKNKIER